MPYQYNEPPVRSSFDGKDGKPDTAWVSWVGQIHDTTGTLIESGTTAKRPSIKFIGQQYFDTSLGANGKPIFASKTGVTWVDATGAIV